jgi:hypothetical protein
LAQKEEARLAAQAAERERIKKEQIEKERKKKEAEALVSRLGEQVDPDLIEVSPSPSLSLSFFYLFPFSHFVNKKIENRNRRVHSKED